MKGGVADPWVAVVVFTPSTTSPGDPDNRKHPDFSLNIRLCSSNTMRTQMLSTVLRAATRPAIAARATPLLVRPASGHAQESFEQFSERYVNFFQNAEDLFEVQRGLNNCFAHDLVPSSSVVEAALRASRRVNDYSTAVRVFEGIRDKVENKQQYQAYLEELKAVREELGMYLY